MRRRSGCDALMGAQCCPRRTLARPSESSVVRPVLGRGPLRNITKHGDQVAASRAADSAMLEQQPELAATSPDARF